MSSDDDDDDDFYGDGGPALEDLEEEPLPAESPRAKSYREISCAETFIWYDEITGSGEDEDEAANESAQYAAEEDDSRGCDSPLPPPPDFLPVEYLLSTLEQRSLKGAPGPRGGSAFSLRTQ